jgi:hypothetical protein
MPGIGWFGANISGFENSSELKTIGDYGMAIFGWQALLDGDGYIGELDQLVEQCQKVKAANPKTRTIVYIDGLRVEPFYSKLHAIMRDPAYEDFFLRNSTYKTADNPGFVPATTYCAQMMSNHAPAFSKHKPTSLYDPKCLSWYWNWFNASAVDFYLNTLVAEQAAKPGFDGVFFDGSDGFMRGTWKQAENVNKNLTNDDALKVMVDVHVRGAKLLYQHSKYAIYSEHLHDTTPAQQAYVAEQMKDLPYFRFFEYFMPEQQYIEQLLNETQRTGGEALPLVIHQPLKVSNDTTANDKLLSNSVAALLVARGEYSYYLASTGWFDYDWVWHPKVFDPQYGTPLGPATFTRSAQGGRTYTRKYSNCDVTVVCPSSASGTCDGTVEMHSTAI